MLPRSSKLADSGSRILSRGTSGTITIRVKRDLEPVKSTVREWKKQWHHSPPWIMHPWQSLFEKHTLYYYYILILPHRCTNGSLYELGMGSGNVTKQHSWRTSLATDLNKIIPLLSIVLIVWGHGKKTNQDMPIGTTLYILPHHWKPLAGYIIGIIIGSIQEASWDDIVTYTHVPDTKVQAHFTIRNRISLSCSSNILHAHYIHYKNWVHII